MPDALKTRVHKVLDKLGLPHQDISGQADPERITAAFYVQATGEQGDTVDMSVLLPSFWKDVWVQVGVDVGAIADQPEEWLVEQMDELDSGLQYAPAGLFALYKLPKFRERGFHAHVTWSTEERRIIAAVTIPPKEFGSASLASAMRLAVVLGNRAATGIATSLQDEPQESEAGGEPELPAQGADDERGD